MTQVTSIKTAEVELPLRVNFRSAITSLDKKKSIVIEVKHGSHSGLGEVSTLHDIFKEKALLESNLIPHYLKTGEILGRSPASAGLSCALKDLEAKQKGIPLWKLYGGEKRPIPVGVTIGLQENTDSLLRRIEESLWAKRIKLKITPETKREVFDEIFKSFPNAPISLDANQTFDDEPLYLGKYPFMMIEEPMKGLKKNAIFQSKIDIPVCLDESIRNLEDCVEAIKLKAGRIVSIKFSLVGETAFKMNKLCEDAGIGCWAGGMLESAIGRAHNLALSTLPNFIYPSDVTTGHFVQDLFEIPVIDGFVIPSDEAGIGYSPGQVFLS